MLLGVVIAGVFLVVLGIVVLPKGSGQQVAPVADIKQEQQIQGTSQESAFAKRFIAYSDESLAKATSTGRSIVFFHAGWCPSCKQAQDDLQANFDKVPQDVTILKTDYDTSKDLKAKYGITMQDTWVQVDSSGKELSKWNSGGKGLETLLANLK